MKYISKFLFLTLIGATAVYFSSCEKDTSSKINQDRIFTIYELYYNANADITYARATFKYGNSAGTLMQLNKGSVSFIADGQNSSDFLSFKETLAYYEKKYEGFVSSGTFSYEDEDGNSYSNTISIDSIAYPDSLTDIIKGSGYELYFEGSSAGEDDIISLTIEGLYNGEINTFYQTDADTAGVILSPENTSELSTGLHVMYLDRRNEPVISEAPNAGGKITGRYRTLSRNIKVRE